MCTSRISVLAHVRLTFTNCQIAFVDLERKKSAVPSKKLPRSHSDAEVQFRRVRQLSVTQLPRVTLQRAAMVTRAVVRMKFLTTNRPTDTEEEASPGLSPRPPCGSIYCAYAREKGPLVVQGSLLVFYLSLTDSPV
jgi:hypothetical protein